MDAPEKKVKKVKFTQFSFDRICKMVASSDKPLKIICKANGVTPYTFFNWLNGGTKATKEIAAELANKYARAQEYRSHYMVEQILSIADNKKGDVLRIKELKNADGSKTYVAEENAEFTNRSKLKIEARKWYAGKLNPKKYGDNSQLEVTIKKLGKDIPEEYV